MKKLYLVSHTHWDREWYRTFQQFRLRLVHLIDGVLNLIDTDPSFKYFTLDGQTIVLDDYLAVRPENEDKIRRYVRNGRLVIGPWHILPDEFLVSPEATIRNLLEGGRTCAKFGPKMDIGYIPDPFGHIGQMPQILHGFNIDSACVQRGLSDERCEFWWQAPDGSRVFMAYLRDGYGNAAGLPVDDQQHFTSEVRRLRDSLLPHSNSNGHLLLMHGTDHMEPSFHTSQAIASTREKLDGYELVHSTLSKYMVAVQANLKKQPLPTVYGELRDCKRSHLLPGVLSTRMWIKQRNNNCESTLEKWVEPFSTFASLIPHPVVPVTSLQDPAPIIRQAWRWLMECHPHDSICGCSIDQVHDEMKVRFDQVDQVNEELLHQSLDLIAANLNTSVESENPKNGSSDLQAPLSTLVIFNPHSFACTDSVDAEVECGTTFDLIDEAGTVIPYQNHSLGSRQLINIQLSPRELQQMYVAAHDGRVMGYSIIDMESERLANVVRITARVSEKLPPNARAWQRGIADIENWIKDGGIETFHIQVFSMDNSRITFIASEVPALGWKSYFIRPRIEITRQPLSISPLARVLLPLVKLPFFQKLASPKKKSRPPYRLETDCLIVEAKKDGSLLITDKVRGNTWQGMNTFKDGGDCGDEYNYCPPVTDKLIQPRLREVSIDDGLVRKTMLLTFDLVVPAALSPDRKKRSSSTVKSTLTSRISLVDGSSRIDIQTAVGNCARDHRLRVHFPTPFSVDGAEHDGHFEVVERKLGLPAFDVTWVEQPRPEVPQRAFTSISNGKQRLTVANRGLPEVEVMRRQDGGDEVALTLLRCVGWLSRDDFSNRKGHAGPYLETPGAQMLGSWTFDYAIVFDQAPVTSRQQAYYFQSPLRAQVTGIHAGSLEKSGSFVNISSPDFLISSIKQAENGPGWLVRGYNQSTQEIQVSLKTILPFKKVALGNLAENSKNTLKPDKEGVISFPARAHEIVTLLFQEQ